MKDNLIFYAQIIVIIWIIIWGILNKSDIKKVETGRNNIINNEKLQKAKPEIYKNLTSDSYDER